MIVPCNLKLNCNSISRAKNELASLVIYYGNMGQRSEPKLAFTVQEAAEMLSLSRAHLYRLMDLQEIGSISIGRSRRITSNQLNMFLNKLEEKDSYKSPSNLPKYDVTP